MRRLKALYLIPVALVLLIGAGFAFYYLLLKPQIEAVKTAQSSWSSAREALKSVESKYDSSLADQVKYAQKIIGDNTSFHQIQDRMPMIYDVKDAPDWKTDRDRLRYWYNVMGTGKMVNILSHWAKGYHLPNIPSFSFSGTLGYESTLPQAKFVNVDFGTQSFFALGYPQLLQKINKQTGYDYFPLIIDLGSPVSIDVDSNNPRHRSKTPALSLKYSATGYFFTRGWDLMSKDDVDKARTHLTQKAKEPARDEQAKEAECPTVLWYFKPAGLAK